MGDESKKEEKSIASRAFDALQAFDKGANDAVAALDKGVENLWNAAKQKTDEFGRDHVFGQKASRLKDSRNARLDRAWEEVKSAFSDEKESLVEAAKFNVDRLEAIAKDLKSVATNGYHPADVNRAPVQNTPAVEKSKGARIP